MRPDPVEVIARARWERDQKVREMMRPKYPPFGAGSIAVAADPITWEDITDEMKESYFHNVRDDLAALKDAGYAVVEVEKLGQCATQKLTAEMTEEEIELGDFEGAYDTLVSESRAMLRASQEG